MMARSLFKLTANTGYSQLILIKMKKEQNLENSTEQALTIPIVTCRYFIYVFYQAGNIGSRDVTTIDEQPKDGFETEQDAERHLQELILAKKGHFFDRSWYKFTIMKTWNSLSAV